MSEPPEDLDTVGHQCEAYDQGSKSQKEERDIRFLQMDVDPPDADTQGQEDRDHDKEYVERLKRQWLGVLAGRRT